MAKLKQENADGTLGLEIGFNGIVAGLTWKGVVVALGVSNVVVVGAVVVVVVISLHDVVDALSEVRLFGDNSSNYYLKLNNLKRFLEITQQ